MVDVFWEILQSIEIYIKENTFINEQMALVVPLTFDILDWSSQSLSIELEQRK